MIAGVVMLIGEALLAELRRRYPVSLGGGAGPRWAEVRGLDIGRGRSTPWEAGRSP